MIDAVKCFSKDLRQPDLGSQDIQSKRRSPMALTERLSKKTDVTQNWLLQFVRLTVSGFAEFSEVSRFLV